MLDHMINFFGLSIEQIVHIITVFSLSISPAVYFYKKHHEKNMEKKQASRNLYEELNDARLTLHGDREVIKKILDYGKEYEMYCVFLNHDVYDSLIFSGKFNFLNYKLQQSIQDIFSKIKDRNTYIQKLVDYEDFISMKKNTKEELKASQQKYAHRIVTMDKYLLIDLPKIMNELHSEFKIKTSKIPEKSYSSL